MNYKVLTETGSVYEINNDTKKWTRLSTAETSGFVRTKDGDIFNVEPIIPIVGQPIKILTNIINPVATYRLLTTSNIVSFEVI